MSSEAWRPRVEVQAGKAARTPRFARILPPGSEAAVAPIEWRRAGTAATGPIQAAASQDASAARIAQLQQQCEQRVREAHTAGLREGEAAAKTRAVSETQPVLEKLALSIAELTQMRPRLRRQAEGDVIKLSLAIARRVLRREIAIDADAIRGLVFVALEKLQAQESSRVRVHPSHAASIAALLKETDARIEVIPDSALAPGGVIFETNQGNLDASVESQLQEIERGLADHLRKQP